MDPKHKELLGPDGADDADARGEHAYPGETPKRRSRGAAAPPFERSHYVAGADGTQRIPRPDEAAPEPVDADSEEPQPHHD